jgi:serine/threonine protein kinase/Flp pilus assembly protein TadD
MNPTIPDYTITRLLGQGGMAEVYAGLDPALDRPVAIKLIHPRLAVDAQFEERFRQEARLVASLRHPHIVQVYDYQVTDDGPVMVMEFLPGGSLKERLDDLRARGERLPLAEAARITDALASALEYAHRQGAVHRDVKPANVLFDREGAPVLADFGIARILDDDSGLTRPGTIIGTPAYLSPEQASGEVVGPASDLYSLGVVLYEMVTGTPPFQGTTTAILTGHASTPPPAAASRVAGLPAAVDEILRRALAKSPADRFPSSAALALAFRAAMRADIGAAIRETDVAAPLTDQPTLIEAPQTAGDASPAPAATPRAPQPAGTDPNDDRMAQLAEKLDVLSPLIGHSIPDAYRDGRSRLATTLGLIGLLFAALKFLTDFLDLAQKAWRPVGLALQSLPVLVGLLLLTGAGAALVSLRRPNRMLNRQRALGLFVGLALAALLWSGWTVAQWLRPPDKLIVAIGEFERFSSRVGNPAGDLFVAMERTFAPLQARVSVQRTYRTYTSAAEAKADGVARSAVALIWGSYSDDGVTVYLEAMDPPAQAKIGGVTLSLRQFSGLAKGLGLTPDATVSPSARFDRQPLYIPDRVSFAAAETEQMTAAAAGVLGLSFQLAGDRSTAAQLYDQAIGGLGKGENLVGAATVYFQRGVLRWENGDQAGAIADLEQVIALDWDNYPAHYNLAIFYASGCVTPERLAQAIAKAEHAASLRPADDALSTLLASLYFQAGRLEDALALLTQPGTAPPGDPASYLFLAQLYTSLGQQAEADAAVDAALALLTAQPAEDVENLLVLGNAYVLAERYDEALTTYRQITEAAPELPEGWRGLGDAYYWLRDPESAMDAYQRVAELTPEDPDAYLLQGLTAANEENRAGAIAAFSQAASLSPCDATPSLLLGGQYVLDDNYAQGMAAFEAALAIDPANENALYLLGSSQVAQGDWAKAEATYTRAVALNPNDPALLRSLAQALSAQGKAVESEDPWRRYTELVTDDSEAWQYLALVLLYQGRNPEAEEAVRRGLAVTEEAGLFVTLGMALDGQGRDKEAAAAYGMALELDPTTASAYRGLGEIARRSSATQTAIDAYENAARLSGATADFVVLAALYQLRGQIPEGLKAIEAALAVEPENGDALLRAGLLQRDAGNLSTAESHFQQASTVNPEDPLPLLGLVHVAYLQCRLSSAAQAARQMVERNPAAFFRGTLASVYLAQGRENEALAIVDELRASPPDDAESHGAAARLLLRLDRLEEALAEFQLAADATGATSASAGLISYELGGLYLLLGQPLPGSSEYSRALALRPGLIPAQAGLGDVALWQGDADKAADIYADALAALPLYRPLTDQEDYEAFAGITQGKLALALARMGRGEEAAEMQAAAIARLNQLVASLPQSPTAHFSLALLHLLAEDAAAADSAFAQAVQCDASLTVVREQMGKILAELQD